MGIVRLKNLPKLSLVVLLKRRKKSLKQFMDEFGITTYEELKSRCERIGVVEPSVEAFRQVNPTIVNSPTEGVLVLGAPPIVHEHTGKVISEPVELSIDNTPKKLKRKKNDFLDDSVPDESPYQEQEEKLSESDLEIPIKEFEP